MSSHLTFRAIAFALLLAIGCAEESSNDNGEGGSAQSAKSVDVTPDAGGTLDDAASGLRLAVPSGAVSEAISVSLAVGTKTSETVSPVFQLSPEDTLFEIPATLSIELADASVPAGMALAIAQEVDGEWSVIEGSQLQSGGVGAPINSLGSFAAILVEVEPASLCDESCMSQPDAVCCTGCGCGGSGSCTPLCEAPYVWDCELTCCFDYEALICAP